MSEEKTIEQQIREIRDQLKALSKKWAVLIAEEMCGDSEKNSVAKVYNIVNNIITNPEDRTSFIIAAAKVHEDLKGQKVQVADALNSLTQ